MFVKIFLHSSNLSKRSSLMKKWFVSLFLAITLSVSGTTYYVSPGGSDSNAGTIDKPFATLTKAWSVVSAGDIVYMRGGTYRFGSTTNLSGKSGSSGNLITISNYPGESPVINFDNITFTTGCVGIKLTSVNYLHLKGIRICNINQPAVGTIAQYGIILWSNVSNCTFEQIECDHIGGWGFVIGDNCYDDLFLNCDSHHNADPVSATDKYGWSDGFECGSASSDRIVFRNCRAWWNSDDGWDLRHANGHFTFDNCWSFYNGYVPGTFTRAGNGTAYKLGGKTSPSTTETLRTISRSLAYKCSTGFDPQPDASDQTFSTTFYNCTAYQIDHSGFPVTYYTEADLLRNCIQYQCGGGSWAANGSYTVHDHNSWDSSVSISDADFVTVDPTGLDGARKSDGSLPDINFLHLATGSDLIDAGRDVGFSYSGKAPDMGYFESGTATTVSSPVYVSSVIQNASPSVIEITFNLALANSVPSASAFAVMVGSSARSVSSVTVSGTKVMLTLSSAVKNGESVTVAYTKPSSNALQSSAGGQVASFSAQKVTNNVAAATTPTVPAYVSSSVESASPSKLTIVYNLSLANTIPAASAFSVTVNSTARAVSSVSVSGSTVILTLSGAVAAGDAVKVAYTKPSLNPIQSTSGGQAASFTAQTVTNNIQLNNSAPVAVVSYKSTTYSGFVNELNASGSYDPNKDNITFSWVIPSNIPVSATTGATIQYLSPVSGSKQKVQFVLNISDGKTTTSKTIPVDIEPYKPDLDVAEVVKVDASGFTSPNYPANIIDGNIGTMWASNGDNQWVLLELKEPFSVQYIDMAFQSGQKKTSVFDIVGSDDMITWEPILSKTNSCAFSGALQVFDFPASKADKEFKYIKLIGHGNSTDSWNYISEFRIFGYKHKDPTSYEELPVKIYPNPARDYFTVRIDETSIAYDFLKIISLTGKILFQERVEQGVSEFRVPIDLLKGIYLIQMGAGKITMFSQKLIVSN